MRKAKCKAKGLQIQLNRFEYVFLTKLWNDILGRFSSTSKTTQQQNINLETVIITLLNSLETFVQRLRERFDYYEGCATLKCPEGTYDESTKRKKTRSSRMKFFDGPSEEVEL